MPEVVDLWAPEINLPRIVDFLNRMNMETLSQFTCLPSAKLDIATQKLSVDLSCVRNAAMFPLCEWRNSRDNLHAGRLPCAEKFGATCR